MNINTDAFSHGQIISKLWLIEELEKHVQPDSTITILGGWYNVLGFMMQIRKPSFYKLIRNIDKDPLAISIAEKITDAWKFDNTIVNDFGNGNATIDYPANYVCINCSVEHFENNAWYDKLPKGTLVCIQSSDITDPADPWFITQPSPDLQTFQNRFPISNTLFIGTKRIQYSHFGYNRFMLIGII